MLAGLLETGVLPISLASMENAKQQLPLCALEVRVRQNGLILPELEVCRYKAPEIHCSNLLTQGAAVTMNQTAMIFHLLGISVEGSQVDLQEPNQHRNSCSSARLEYRSTKQNLDGISVRATLQVDTLSYSLCERAAC
jgi:hypothetical protein